MNILPIFHFQNEEEAVEAMKIAKHYPERKNEDMSYCLLREAGMEILFLKESNLPFLVVCRDSVYDTNIKMEDFQEFTPFIRCHFKKIKISDLTIDVPSPESVMKWYKCIDKKFLKRKITSFHPDNFFSAINNGEIAFPVFIKTEEKMFTGISLCSVFDSPEDIPLITKADDGVFFDYKAPDWYCPYRDSMEAGFHYSRKVDCEIVVSEPIDIKKDDFGKIEFRCYIIHGEFVNASRYLDYEHTDTPTMISDFATSFAQCHKSVLPPHYVLDLAVTTDGVQIVELNPIPASGRYVDNKPSQIYEKLLVDNSYICLDNHLKEIPDINKKPAITLSDIILNSEYEGDDEYID